MHFQCLVVPEIKTPPQCTINNSLITQQGGRNYEIIRYTFRVHALSLMKSGIKDYVIEKYVRDNIKR